MTFEAIPFKPWTLTDTTIILGKKEYPIDSISHIKHTPCEPGDSCGFFFAKFGGKLFKTTLAYSAEQKTDAEKAKQYIFAIIRGDDPNKAVEKFEAIQEHGYRKICNVCGHLFCYTQDDLKKNQKLIHDATFERNMGKTEWWTTSMVTGNQRQQRADELESRIVDYSKCPKCGSKELRDATDEDIEKSKAPQGTIVQQTSTADELKKYKELLDQGIITQEEFDAKKKQLLGL